MTGLKSETCEEPGANVELKERRLLSLKQKSQWCSGASKGGIESVFVWLLTRLTYREKKTFFFLNKELHFSHFLIS